MKAPNDALSIVPPMPADEANPQQVARSIEVERQRAEGRTGGGPRCPGCKRRALRPMPQSRLFQCAACHTVVQMGVGPAGFEVKPVGGLEVAWDRFSPRPLDRVRCELTAVAGGAPREGAER